MPAAPLDRRIKHRSKASDATQLGKVLEVELDEIQTLNRGAKTPAVFSSQAAKFHPEFAAFFVA
jgi:hypothetical protein